MNNTSMNDILLIIPFQLNIWFGTFLCIMGNISCFGNMLLFGSRLFRKQAYSIYLFSTEIINFFYFNFILLTRIIEKGYQIPLMNQYNIICKFRQFGTIWSNLISFSLFSFATIDRLLSIQRSNTYRQWSNRVSLAYKIIILCPIFWFIVLVHRIIFYRIQDGICGPVEGFYEYFDNYFQVIFSSFSPSIIMSILAYLLIRNIRKFIQRKIIPINDISKIIKQNHNKIDTQLTLMLILQSFIAILTYIPYTIELIYTNITDKWYKTSLRLSWEKIFIELIHLFSYIFFASSFYILIISHVGFRRKIKQLLGIK